MMIKIHNDGKEKSISWDARITLEVRSSIGGGFGSADLVGHGATEEDAIEMQLKI